MDDTETEKVILRKSALELKPEEQENIAKNLEIETKKGSEALIEYIKTAIID